MILYHMTPEERLPSIMVDGIQPNQTRCMCGHGMHTHRPIWLTPFPHMIYKLQGSRARGKIAVLAVNIQGLKIAPWGKSRVEFVTDDVIPPDRVKVLSTFRNGPGVNYAAI